MCFLSVCLLVAVLGRDRVQPARSQDMHNSKSAAALGGRGKLRRLVFLRGVVPGHVQPGLQSRIRLCQGPGRAHSTERLRHQCKRVLSSSIWNKARHIAVIMRYIRCVAAVVQPPEIARVQPLQAADLSRLSKQTRRGHNLVTA